MLTVLLNPASASANNPDLKPRIIELFRASGVDVRLVVLPRDAVDATIAEALRAKPHTVAAAGGDGTVSSVAAAVAGSATPFGILPLGTLNHFAKDLHIPLDLAQAVHTIASRHIVVVDAAQVNGRVFVNNSSIGLYPSVVERREALRKQGHRKWPAFAMAATQVLSRSEDVSVRLNVDGRQIVTRTPFVFVGNNEYHVSGIHVGARARLDSGRLFACLAPRVKTRDLPRLVMRALAGRISRGDGFATFAAAEIWIENLENRQISVSSDGEVKLMATPLHYQALARALNVFAPAPG